MEALTPRVGHRHDRGIRLRPPPVGRGEPALDMHACPPCDLPHKKLVQPLERTIVFWSVRAHTNQHSVEELDTLPPNKPISTMRSYSERLHERGVSGAISCSATIPGAHPRGPRRSIWSLAAQAAVVCLVRLDGSVDRP